MRVHNIDLLLVEENYPIGPFLFTTKTMIFRGLLKVILLVVHLIFVSSFHSLAYEKHRTLASRLWLNKKSVQTAEFEFQEMRAVLNDVVKRRISSRDLDPTQRAELEGYVRQVVQKRQSPTPLSEIGNKLPGTTWRLAFSTEQATLGDLPRDACIMLDFVDGKNMDYVLAFSEKTLGLNKIKAKSNWFFDPSQGLVTFVYDRITSDAFGLQDINIGFFGLLKGRANFVNSSYFDGNYWIEQGFSSDGRDYLNVYVKA